MTGIEEATLGAESALRSVALRNGAVIDLGGGSLQWTTVRERRLKHALSLPHSGVEDQSPLTMGRLCNWG